MFARPVWQVICVLLGKKEREEELNSMSAEQWSTFLTNYRSGVISTEGIVEIQECKYFRGHIEDFVSKRLKRKQGSSTQGASCNMIY